MNAISKLAVKSPTIVVVTSETHAERCINDHFGTITLKGTSKVLSRNRKTYNNEIFEILTFRIGTNGVREKRAAVVTVWSWWTGWGGRANERDIGFMKGRVAQFPTRFVWPQLSRIYLMGDRNPSINTVIILSRVPFLSVSREDWNYTACNNIPARSVLGKKMQHYGTLVFIPSKDKTVKFFFFCFFFRLKLYTPIPRELSKFCIYMRKFKIRLFLRQN